MGYLQIIHAVVSLKGLIDLSWKSTYLSVKWVPGLVTSLTLNVESLAMNANILVFNKSSNTCIFD